MFKSLNDGDELKTLLDGLIARTHENRKRFAIILHNKDDEIHVEICDGRPMEPPSP